jgi:GNAT superfamily N-acetyltransferase
MITTIPAGDDLYQIDDNPERLDLGMIHDYLSRRSYWAQGRSIETVIRSVRNSLCFGVYRGEAQVGFARVVTDRATFAWLCDVFIDENERGKGLGKALVKAVVDHPDLQGLRRMMLATRDAHLLYQEHGEFEPLSDPARWMERLNK